MKHKVRISFCGTYEYTTEDTAHVGEAMKIALQELYKVKPKDNENTSWFFDILDGDVNEEW